jgi:hypothetical protein
MIKTLILAPRRAGMSHDEFRKYVTEVHAPLLKSVAEVVSDIRCCHYNFPLAGATDVAFGHQLARSFDVVTEVWFDSIEAQRQNMRHPRYVEIVRPDTCRFADGEQAVMHYTREIPVVDGERTKFRVFYFRRRRRGLYRSEFQELWLEGALHLLGNGNRGRLPAGVTAYVQNHTAGEGEHPDGEDEKYCDVVDEFFLEHPDALAGLVSDRILATALRALEGDLLYGARTRAFIGETLVNIPWRSTGHAHKGGALRRLCSTLPVSEPSG